MKTKEEIFPNNENTNILYTKNFDATQQLAGYKVKIKALRDEYSKEMIITLKKNVPSQDDCIQVAYFGEFIDKLNELLKKEE